MENITWEQIRESERKINQMKMDRIKRYMDESYPDVDLAECKIKFDIHEDYVYPNGKEMYVINVTYGVVKVNTLLGSYLEDKHYQILENGYHTTLIEDNGDYVCIRKFYSSNGEKVKNVRFMRDVKETSKGRYIMLDKKRIYLEENK
ncbi:hypothetical protein P4639_22040 [Priestia megaterium]|uniref:hypothetical protein n=1 Tax=Priestia megaterium TaxID=1404 RepID=UPI002E24681F|nr:hypothetical protein [Priestia megaterium]